MTDLPNIPPSGLPTVRDLMLADFPADELETRITAYLHVGRLSNHEVVQLNKLGSVTRTRSLDTRYGPLAAPVAWQDFALRLARWST